MWSKQTSIQIHCTRSRNRKWKWKNRLITNFLGWRAEKMAAHMFYEDPSDRIVSLGRNRYVQRKRNQQAKYPLPQNTRLITLQSMPSLFRKTKEICKIRWCNAPMSEMWKEKVVRSRRKPCDWRNATRDREGCVRIHYYQVTFSWLWDRPKDNTE